MPLASKVDTLKISGTRPSQPGFNPAIALTFTGVTSWYLSVESLARLLFKSCAFHEDIGQFGERSCA